MADKTVRYTPLQEAAKHTEVRQVSDPCHSLHPTALCIERLLPMSIQGVASALARPSLGVSHHGSGRQASRRRQGSYSALGCVWIALGIAVFGRMLRSVRA